MVRDLMLAIGIPVALPQRLSERPSLIWNIGIGLTITLSFLRWLLQR